MPAGPSVDRLIEQGHALLARHSPGAAAECFLAAAAADPRSTAAAFGLGVARMDQRDFAAARSAFEAVIGIDARHAGAHFNLGFIARTGGDYAGAARHFAQSVAQRPDHVPAEVMEARRERLMQVQQEITFAALEQQVGRTLDVILDQPVPGERNVWIGRSGADAPDVDGLVFVTGDRHKLRSGDIVLCEIVATQEYDLVAVAAGKPKARPTPRREKLSPGT